MSRHRITAEINVKFWFPGLPDDERESTDVKIDITYDYASGGDLMLAAATLVDGGGLNPTDGQVKDWAQDWLDDEGYDRACAAAQPVPGPENFEETFGCRGCICRMSPVHSASIDPPEPVRNRNCPVHGGRDPDAEYEAQRDDAMERGR